MLKKKKEKLKKKKKVLPEGKKIWGGAFRVRQETQKTSPRPIGGKKKSEH